MQAAALAAGLFCVHCKQHGASEVLGAVLLLVSWCCFITAYLQLLMCCAYVELDAGKAKVGYPGRLLLKPVSTARLVLTPMVFGGVITSPILLVWSEFVLKPLGPFPPFDSVWALMMLLSFFWWMQAVTWSLPLLRTRSLILVVVAVVHLLVAILPVMPIHPSPAMQWAMAAAMLVSAVPVAWMGLSLMRQGSWEGTVLVFKPWSENRLAGLWIRRKRFGSAFGAQFWLEWRRLGLALPSIAVASILAILLIGAVVKRLAGAAPPPEALLSIMVLVPLAIGGAMGQGMANFDLANASLTLPVFISVRPMTNGGFIMAKLAMALATSVLTWLLMAVGAVCFLALLSKGSLPSNPNLAAAGGPMAWVVGFGLVFIFLVLVTWKNLVGGMAAGLTGRRWILTAVSLTKLALLLCVFSLVFWAKVDDSFRSRLLPWLTPILAACLTAKVAVSIAGFTLGLRRNTTTVAAIAWMVGGWLACGLFVSGYAALACIALHHPELWLWLVLGAFLQFPLADLAVSPLALAWNRHR